MLPWVYNNAGTFLRRGFAASAFNLKGMRAKTPPGRNFVTFHLVMRFKNKTL
jgi:hypothetical protein